ncbi:uncharacterized protein J3R85_020138 [Psidium guajava]|nr:uncharacterized protein J3R85_020138 [Psidium guajava]
MCSVSLSSYVISTPDPLYLLALIFGSCIGSSRSSFLEIHGHRSFKIYLAELLFTMLFVLPNEI